MEDLFLGIDQSFTSCGLCVVSASGVVVHHETINTSDVDGDIFDRALKIVDGIDKVIDQFNPVRIGLEGLAFSKFGNATRDLACLQGAIVTHLRYRKPVHSAEMQIVSPNLLKKFATGKGSADKNAMYEALPQVIKDVFVSYKKTKGRSDVVDAYWIANFTLSIYNRTVDNIRPTLDTHQTSLELN